MPRSVKPATVARLRRVEFEDIQFIAALFNEKDVIANDLSMHGAISQYSLQKNFDTLFASSAHDRFIVEDRGKAEAGIISAKAEGSCPGAYSISIAITAEKQRRGLGTAAGNLLIRFLFLCRRAERLSIGVREFNTAGLKWAKACGFEDEGRDRHGCFYDGRYFDVLRFSLLAHEFFQRFPGQAK